MAGVYIHIPFCKTKCPYCDFYSVVSWDRRLQERFVNALLREMELRKNYLAGPVKTVYFGGGTPSLLDPEDLQRIIDKVFSVFPVVKNNLEITAELNPDDINEDFVHKLKNSTQINRISLGVQSFFDDDLKFLGRRHNSLQSKQAIRLLQKHGFSNISIDLIYGLPGMTTKKLEANLRMFLDFHLPHLSAYHLTYEPDTPFGQQLKTGKIKPLEEKQSIKLYDFLMDFMNEYGFLHYEISNFAKPGYISKHNFSYWTGEPYIGLGPAAHSFDGNSRAWNIADLKKYLSGIEQNRLPLTTEKLSEKDKFNEYILTRLRTYLGLDTDFLKNNYHTFFKQIKHKLNSYIETGHLKQIDNNIVLTKAGKKIADAITADLFIV